MNHMCNFLRSGEFNFFNRSKYWHRFQECIIFCKSIEAAISKREETDHQVVAETFSC